MRLILASTSPFRKNILDEANIPCTAMKPLEDEEAFKEHVAHLSIKKQALELSRIKARKLSKQNPQHYILGGDQICSLNQTTINKPKNKQDALNQLTTLSGKTIHLHTAASLFLNGEEVWSTVESPTSTYKNFTKEAAEHYIDIEISENRSPVGCAGAFRIESPNKNKIIENISGNINTIIGMPVKALQQYLKENNVTLEL